MADLSLAQLLGTELPLIQAPMAGVQGSALAIAVSNAGALGSLPGAMLSADAVAEIVPADIGEQLNVLWTDTATQLLKKNQSTLAVVSLAWLLSPDGFLQRLQKLEYEIQAPDQPVPEPQES